MSKQKINKLLIGTNNKGKLREIKSLLPKSIKIYSTSVFNLRSPVENGKTFKENSLIKSKFFSKKTGLVCLADDSGLEIDLLDKNPGIYSARWGGRHGDFDKAIDVLRKKGQKVAAKRADREAAEGVVLAMSSSDENSGAIICLNCETDFVAKNDSFVDLARNILSLALDSNCNDLDEIKQLNFTSSMTINDKLIEMANNNQALTPEDVLRELFPDQKTTSPAKIFGGDVEPDHAAQRSEAYRPPGGKPDPSAAFVPVQGGSSKPWFASSNPIDTFNHFGPLNSD